MRSVYYFFIFSIFSTISLGQKISIRDNKLNGILPVNDQGVAQYQTVQTIEGTTKEDLFKRARKWFTTTYKSGKDVLQVADVSTGELSGKGVFTIQPTMMGMPIESFVDHMLSVEIKDNRYRVTLSNFYLTAKSIKGPIESIRGTSTGFYDKACTQIDERAQALFGSLDKAMRTKEADF